jgi:hypothetical protein
MVMLTSDLSCMAAGARMQLDELKAKTTRGWLPLSGVRQRKLRLPGFVLFRRVSIQPYQSAERLFPTRLGPPTAPAQP